MGATKIQVGYGSDTRQKNRKNSYGKRSSGKLVRNGGFSGEPVVDFSTVSDDRWAEIFGVDSMPKWKRELLERDGYLD
jgi:hypothetical protein